MRSAKQFGLSVGTLAVASVFVLSSQAFAGWGSSGGWGSSSSGGWGSSSSGGYSSWGSSSSSGGGYYTGSSSSSSGGGLFARHRARKAARHSSSSGSSSSGSWGRSGWGSSSSGGYSYGSSSSGGYGHGGSSSSGGGHYNSYNDGGWTPVDEAAPADDAPAPPPAAEAPADPDASIRRMNSSISFTVNVPEDVKIFVNDNPTTSTGTERTYVSRGLEIGKSYTFQVRAELERDGETLTETKQIRLVAGQHTSLAFEFTPNANEQLAEKAVETKLTLNVPAEAKVYLSGHATSSTGPVREFATTKLVPGKSWADYVVVVTYEKDGQLLTQEKNVTIEAGTAREVTFDFNADTVASVQR